MLHCRGLLEFLKQTQELSLWTVTTSLRKLVFCTNCFGHKKNATACFYKCHGCLASSDKVILNSQLVIICTLHLMGDKTITFKIYTFSQDCKLVLYMNFSYSAKIWYHKLKHSKMWFQELIFPEEWTVKRFIDFNIQNKKSWRSINCNFLKHGLHILFYSVFVFDDFLVLLCGYFFVFLWYGFFLIICPFSCFFI